VRVRIALLLSLLAPAALASAQLVRSDLLVGYSFDDSLIETGPDTFRLFQRAKGRVSLSPLYRVSGRYSVEIQEVAGDGDFPELQGYFPKRSAGLLFLHFAIMTTDEHEELNIALAGTEGFTLAKDGLGFWLRTEGGWLRQVSDSVPKKLFRMRPFVFYLVDVTYDIDRGVYDLQIAEEGKSRAIVDLEDQSNATSSPGSNVSMFSFIGDRGDDSSNAHYFVDDILVSVDREIVHLPFQAPGRRKLFIDAWHEDKISSAADVHCPRLEQPEDFGVAAGDVRVEAWRDGCRALEAGGAEAALVAFDRALRDQPGAALVDLSRALALAKLQRWQEAELALARTYRSFQGDTRWDIVAAAVSFLHGDLDHAEEALSRSVASAPEASELSESAVTAARRYLLLLLWNGRPEHAVEVAQHLVATSRATKQPQAEWLELLGDALFYAGRAKDAVATYKLAFAGHSDQARLDEKLSDAYFKLGDLAKERQYRERVWGTLKP
jgi:hypothetical protein